VNKRSDTLPNAKKLPVDNYFLLLCNTFVVLIPYACIITWFSDQDTTINGLKNTKKVLFYKKKIKEYEGDDR